MTAVLTQNTPLAPSLSSQEETALHQLNTMHVPDTELDDLLNQHESMTLQELLDAFDVVTDKIHQWIQAAHLTVFTMEQNLKNDDDSILNTESLDKAFSRMQPMVALLVDIGDIIEEKDEASPKKMSVKITITKIQSEWSGLQHFLASVKKAVEDAHEKKMIMALMEGVLLQVDDLSTLIFQFQERRHAVAASVECIQDGDSLSDQEKSMQLKDDKILVEIDNRVGPLFNDVEKVYARMTSGSPPQDAAGVLARKHHVVQERWECLRIEIDELKDELKEDRWLAVFRQVADQVEGLIDGLDKTVGQCYAMIQQVRDWQASQGTGSPQFPSKSILRNVPKSNHSSASVSSTSSSGSTGVSAPPLPVDHSKFRSVEKNFEAKFKYCTPSISKMLDMLGNEIAARGTQDSATLLRHDTMVQRWSQLRIAMDDLRIRDLPETERILMFERPISPAWSRFSDMSDRSQSSWKDMRYRSPEPNMHEFFDYRSPSGARSGSPYSKMIGALPKRDQSPTNLYHAYDETRRGRSATPSSGSMRRAINSGNSPSPVFGRTQRTGSPLSSSRDVSSFTGSTLRPSSSDSSSTSSNLSLLRANKARSKTPTLPAKNPSAKTTRKEWLTDHETKREASWMKPTKSTLLRKQNEKDDIPPRPSTRSKTPTTGHYQRAKTPTRPRSSVGQHDSADRSETPVRRSGTPSLIPRPKTPSSNDGGYMRAASPCFIPRPRSSMARLPTATKQTQAGSMLHVVSSDSDDSHPTNNSFLSVPDSSNRPSQTVQGRRTLHKKYSTPALRQRSHSPFRLNQAPMAQTPPPLLHHRRGGAYSSEEEDSAESLQIAFKDYPAYVADPRDPLDMEVANIVNGSPISINCQKGPHGPGRYYFGNELNPSLGGGKKLYTCKLMDYTDRDSRRGGGGAKIARNKVLVRVGGGWQDLEIFLLEHANLMTSDVVVRSFVNTNTKMGWRN
ncbi:hypothetical protein DFQ28_006424 [Apophysomyces sp. BC1034]|nr:hypothetical protein DFQ30_000395 [Apophysomyces sp. BC1015]KAG0178131.1 hypothetical protein DFQ29_003886 [Apophysomyces sp. BC1021]KAG0187373.1 hypothetical protein DFQ28_006424 [Apophysomyces sp. BC1034]